MATSPATTVQEYLGELPADRAAVVAHVRHLVNASLPPGYVEGMLHGTITWSVPPEVYPDTYSGKPLAYVSLAAQENYYALYLMGGLRRPVRGTRRGLHGRPAPDSWSS